MDLMRIAAIGVACLLWLSVSAGCDGDGGDGGGGGSSSGGSSSGGSISGGSSSDGSGADGVRGACHAIYARLVDSCVNRNELCRSTAAGHSLCLERCSYLESQSACIACCRRIGERNADEAQSECPNYHDDCLDNAQMCLDGCIRTENTGYACPWTTAQYPVKRYSYGECH